MTHKTPYSDQIARLAPGYDPRHVEAYMRVEHGTLDALSPSRFLEEVTLAIACIEEGGKAMAGEVARSFGF